MLRALRKVLREHARASALGDGSNRRKPPLVSSPMATAAPDFSLYCFPIVRVAFAYILTWLVRITGAQVSVFTEDHGFGMGYA